ncbi:helix-turn-helix domain-containing protein [Candidatus Poriferisodalis sp.]|uniref:AraC family transcriptional regulator n=1 Tax=Candidatus Poriferisodalis sp. TaxID=3101277 RepID=UPI003B02EA9D
MTSAVGRHARADGILWAQTEVLDLIDLLVDVMFCMKDTESRYLVVNHAFVRRAGRNSKRDVVGQRAADLFSAPLAERYEEQDRRVFTTGRPLRDELELIRREDGGLGWYVTTKLPVPADDDPRQVRGLVSISRDLRTTSSGEGHVRALRSVVEYVRAHLSETIRVSHLAAAAGLSQSQLERRMRNAFGLSAMQYVLRARVELAAELLSDSDLAIAEVAVMAGFYDQSDLTKRFARLTNETPAQFRDLQRNISR